MDKMMNLLTVLLFFLISLTGCNNKTNKPISLQDNFENSQIADFWRPGDLGSGRYVAGAVSISTEYARAGKSSVKLNLQKGFIRQDGGDGNFTERTELDSRKHPFLNEVVWIKFSVLIPEDFPIVDNRLIISQLKQVGQSKLYLIFAQRFKGGRHYFTVLDVTKEKKEQIYFELPDLVKNKWHDFIFKVYLTEKPSGFIKIWMNRKKVLEFKGKTAHKNGINSFYHKFGLYRDEWDDPMTIYFDEFLLSNDDLSSQLNSE